MPILGGCGKHKCPKRLIIFETHYGKRDLIMMAKETDLLVH